MRKLLVSAAAIGVLAVAGVMQSGTPAHACAGDVGQVQDAAAFSDANPTVQKNGKVGFWDGGTIVLDAEQAGDNASGPVVSDGGALGGTQLDLGQAVRTIPGECDTPN